ncbi:lipase family protein [Pseudomonas koreensis]|uniref:lipase family protein n=1 Tax=Pseudomonas koreensis TaxID=198620 RepID=UPI0021C97939|nr:lipase family protein [Pseudomonas koreensis]MCU0075179.1 lipase family protein [Pseudomonas koreensis]
MTSLEKDLQSPLSSRLLNCPVGGNWTSFQLIDEFCSGKPYAGLAYVATDSEGYKYTGRLDAEGRGRVDNHFAGPVSLLFDQAYEGNEKFYSYLQVRPHYPLKITEIQVRAEATRYLNPNTTRTRERPEVANGGDYFQVEVRHLVRHVSHLPPEVYRDYPMDSGCAAIMREHGKLGAALMPQRHTVLEVRPLRSLRPMLSTAPEFCALNLYQLALMATLSYSPFGQKPKIPSAETKTVGFPLQPSIGNWFGDSLAKCEELWKVDSAQTKAYYPLYEDIPYSRRLEIIPFDPNLYPMNRPTPTGDLEHPASVHFLDDIGNKNSTDTQAFITHNDELILIAVRGTAEIVADGLRDADALQVPFSEGEGQVHRGFYEAAKKAAAFAVSYLDRFYTGQTLLICGHSLGGAITLLLSEMLRRRAGFNYNIQLYTYGAPRAGDADFVRGAADLVHHRMVNHNDPVPSVPGSWMNTKADLYGAGAALTFVIVPLGLSVFVAGITNWTGEAYDHHGSLRHAMPVEFGRQQVSSILWEPGCDTINQHAACDVAIRQRHGLPDRPTLLKQIFDAGHHSMTGAYIPACWAVLRRWQEAQESSRSLVTEREFALVESALQRITDQLRSQRNNLPGRPDSYVRTRKNVVEALNREIEKIRTTRERLALLRHRRMTATDVYGSLAEQPERLAESLPRWQLHPENLAAEQLAMAPDAAEDDPLLATLYGHRIGAPHTFDIDSVI